MTLRDAIQKSADKYAVYTTKTGRIYFASTKGFWEIKDNRAFVMGSAPRGISPTGWEPLEQPLEETPVSKSNSGPLTVLLKSATAYFQTLVAAVSNMESLDFHDARFRQGLDTLIESATALRAML